MMEAEAMAVASRVQLNTALTTTTISMPVAKTAIQTTPAIHHHQVEVLAELKGSLSGLALHPTRYPSLQGNLADQGLVGTAST